jgi:U-box domain/Leucine Rich repeat
VCGYEARLAARHRKKFFQKMSSNKLKMEKASAFKRRRIRATRRKERQQGNQHNIEAEQTVDPFGDENNENNLFSSANNDNFGSNDIVDVFGTSNDTVDVFASNNDTADNAFESNDTVDVDAFGSSVVLGSANAAVPSSSTSTSTSNEDEMAIDDMLVSISSGASEIHVDLRAFDTADAGNQIRFDEFAKHGLMQAVLASNTLVRVTFSHYEASRVERSTRIHRISASQRWLRELLFVFVAKGSPIKELRFAKCEFSSTSARIVAHALSSNTVQSLSLSECRVSNDPGDHALGIGRWLGNCALTDLSLSSCGVADSDVVALARALPSCTVVNLSLVGNPITDDGARSLASLIMHLDCSLQALDVSRTEIGDAGCQALLDALRQDAICTALRVADCRRAGDSLPRQIDALLLRRAAHRSLAGTFAVCERDALDAGVNGELVALARHCCEAAVDSLSTDLRNSSAIAKCCERFELAMTNARIELSKAFGDTHKLSEITATMTKTNALATKVRARCASLLAEQDGKEEEQEKVDEEGRGPSSSAAASASSSSAAVPAARTFPFSRPSRFPLLSDFVEFADNLTMRLSEAASARRTKAETVRVQKTTLANQSRRLLHKSYVSWRRLMKASDLDASVAENVGAESFTPPSSPSLPSQNDDEQQQLKSGSMDMEESEALMLQLGAVAKKRTEFLGRVIERLAVQERALETLRAFVADDARDYVVDSSESLRRDVRIWLVKIESALRSMAEIADELTVRVLDACQAAARIYARKLRVLCIELKDCKDADLGDELRAAESQLAAARSKLADFHRLSVEMRVARNVFKLRRYASVDDGDGDGDNDNDTGGADSSDVSIASAMAASKQRALEAHAVELMSHNERWQSMMAEVHELNSALTECVRQERADLVDSVTCCITFEVMSDPVIATVDGVTYERAAIELWIEEHGTSPMTRQPLSIDDLVSNRVVADIIAKLRQED